MMDTYYDLKDMLCRELDTITRKGEMSAGDLDVIDKLTHSIKSLETIIAMNEADYSRDGSYERDGGNSMTGYYARDERMTGGNSGNYSYGRRRRDSMGRYSRGRYSRDNNELIGELEDLMNEAMSPKSKETIRKAVEKMREM